MPTPTDAPDTGSATASHPSLPALPRLVPLPSAQRTFGPSRATFYRAAAAGQVRLVKVGRGTFVETESALAWLASLPSVTPKAAA